MKFKYVLIVCAIVLLMVGGLLFMRHKGTKIKEEDLDATNIKSFYLTYTNGYMINSYTRYQLSVKDNKYLVEIKPYGVAEEDKLEMEVGEEIVLKISEILKKYEVNKWDGFNKSDHGVMDGDSFSLSVGLSGEKGISASGYMKWPEHYRDVVNEISPLFMNIYNEEKGNKEDGEI